MGKIMVFGTQTRGVFPAKRYLLAMAGDGMNASAKPEEMISDEAQSKTTREYMVIDLYDKLRPALLAYVSDIGLSSGEAEDTIQESFLRFFDCLVEKGELENPRGWLFRVAHNLSIDLLRAGRRFQQTRTAQENLIDEFLATAEDPEESAIRNEQDRRMYAALGRLTEQQRAAVLLRAEDLRYREIAEILGVSIKRVSDLVHRTLSRLAREV